MAKKKKSSGEKSSEVKVKAEERKAPLENLSSAKEDVFTAAAFAERFIESPAKRGAFLYFARGDNSKKTPREWKKFAAKKELKL